MSEATLNTEFGEITIRAEKRYGYGRLQITIGNGEQELAVLSDGQQDEVIEQASVELNGYEQLPAGEAGAMARLFSFSEYLLASIDHANAEAISEQERREAEEEQKREEEAAAQQELETERTEVLMQELVGERVKVRHRNYKTMCYATVEVQPTYDKASWERDDDEEPSGYRVRLRYSDQGATRDSGVGSYARLDAKTEKGWRTVWDDGKDDLPEYDRDVKLPEVRPW
jgi:hypothetical protein